MRKLFLSLVFLSVLLSIHANPGIKGIVIDQTTRKALDYAHVVLYDGNHIVEEAMTEANGSFLIQPVKPGTYSIRIHFLGYDVYMGEEFILTEQIKDLGTIPMRMLEVGLQEVEVVANKKQVIYKLDKKIIEASSNLLSSGGTAVDILENTPSIRVNAEGEVTFRGSSGFTVYVDGKPSIFTGTQALEQIPSGQIQNIEIITTPSAQHDTGGDVGIINVITKKNFGEGLSGVINLSGNTVWSRTLDFLLTGQNKASQWRIGGYVGNRLRKSHFTQEKTTLETIRQRLLIPMAPVKVTATHIFSTEVGAIRKNKRLFLLTRKADMPDSSEKGIWNIRKNVPLMASNSRTESSRALTTLISMRLSD